ncbi:cupin domain-containing protein [Mucilaginibacter sp.]|uniref:cupin domain-containing protein n=1 Tax=Mucilaginibacter sp. TaxID=1882438 RepID=UPI00261AA768|nr:cupin domain-containing protein [Mucilaginibacter sp.]MDB4919136.1 oxalate decarboxylase [Mucilaginibacter sp.]
MGTTTRREFLSATSLSTMGVVIAATGMNALSTETAAASPSKKFHSAPAQAELEDFVFDMANSKAGWLGAGGSAREATVEEFPVSQSIAGVIMRLNPGGFRELHWHSIAGEWAFILEGKVRTTVITPGGTTSTDEFEVGDIWFFPKGYGHSLQCVGNEPCAFVLGFDNGHFSEFGTFSITDWVSHTPPDLIARNSGLPLSVLASLPKKELYIGKGKIAAEQSPSNLNPAIPASFSSHKFRLETDGIKQEFKGGYIKVVSSKEFPIQNTLTSLRMNIEPGAIRELHWHPNADEWQYVISGQGRVTIFGSHGRVKTMDYGKGMVSFIKQGYGHYIENTGKETLKLVVLFNSPVYQELTLNDWLNANPAQLVADHFGLTLDQAKSVSKHQTGIF